MLVRYGRSIAPFLGLLVLSSAPSIARAQNIFNPYGNSGYADYREFARPQFSNDPSLPGQARLQGETIGGGSRANQFEAYTNTLNGRDPEATEGTRNGRPATGPGVPYFQAYRQYDEQYKRVYRPNDTQANREYEEKMKLRNDAYVQALNEKDPVRRSKLLRQIESGVNNRPTPSATSRPAAGSTNRTTAARAPAPPASRAPAATGSRPAVNTGRVAAPPRPSSSAPSNAAATGSTTGAPAPAATSPSTVPIPPPR